MTLIRCWPEISHCGASRSSRPCVSVQLKKAVAEVAVRYCGSLRLTIHYNDAREHYTVSIRELNDDARFQTLTDIQLSPYARQRIAGDSSLAYDEVARAAISFASAEDDHISNYAEYDCDGGEACVRRRVDGPVILRPGVGGVS